MSGCRGTAALGGGTVATGTRGAGLARLEPRPVDGTAAEPLAAGARRRAVVFLRRALSAVSNWFFNALAAVLASLRIRLASFLACLKAFRASFSLALACRANLRAASACCSACVARVARVAAFCCAVRRWLLVWLLFIRLLLSQHDQR